VELLALAELDAADLAGDRLRQLGELEPADALVRREVDACVGEDRPRGLGVGGVSGGEGDVRLRHREAKRVGGGNDRCFRDRGVLDQDALELEGRDAVVGGLEDVVGAPDVGDDAVGVAPVECYLRPGVDRGAVKVMPTIEVSWGTAFPTALVT
jgi:hypothetical protein